VTTPQFMPGILRWGGFREQFNDRLVLHFVPPSDNGQDLQP
jgi:hypothetical protein